MCLEWVHRNEQGSKEACISRPGHVQSLSFGSLKSNKEPNVIQRIRQTMWQLGCVLWSLPPTPAQPQIIRRLGSDSESTGQVSESSQLEATVVQPLAAKSLQSCPTLCDPIDGSPPGSPIPGILQARTLEWVVVSLRLQSLSRIQFFVTPWTVAHQAPLSSTTS